MSDVILYTDGACRGNPGAGGWGVVLMHQASGKRLELSGGASVTTNNRMEMQAVIHGLSALSRPSSVHIVSDSQYVLTGMQQWLKGWKAQGWRKKGGAIKNIDLWKQLDTLMQVHQLSYEWVKGHAGHAENECCDQLACNAADQAVANGDPEDLDNQDQGASHLFEA